MANCCLCGTKIAGFGADKLKLTETEILCHQCAPRFRQLQETTSYEEYISYKKYLLEKIVNSSNLYGANIVKEEIEKYLNIMHGEVALGTGVLSELSASVNDFMGTTSTSLERKLSKAKKIAQERLVTNCLNEGANTIIGIDY